MPGTPENLYPKVVPPSVSGARSNGSAPSVLAGKGSARVEKGPPSTRPPSRVTIAKSQSPAASARPKVPFGKPQGSIAKTAVGPDGSKYHSYQSSQPASMASYSPAASTKKPQYASTASYGGYDTQLSSTRLQGSAKQPVHPAQRATAWYAVEQEHIEPHASPARREPTFADTHVKPNTDMPPEFLAQQWGGGGINTSGGWWQGAALQPDIVTGTFYITSMDLKHVPSSRHKIMEEKAALDIGRLFAHPPWHVQVSLAAGSMVLRYRLELPENGPSAVTLLSRVAAEVGKQAIMLPEVEKEYRMVTGSDAPAIIDYDRSEPPMTMPRAKPLDYTPPENNGWGVPQNAPLEIKAVEGTRRTEVVGPHMSYATSKPWLDLDVAPPLLPVERDCTPSEMRFPQLSDDQFSQASPVRPAISPVRPSKQVVTVNAWEPSPPPPAGYGHGLMVGAEHRRSISPPPPVRTTSISSGLSFFKPERSASYTTHWQGNEIVEVKPGSSSDLVRPPSPRAVHGVREQLKPFLKEQEARYHEAGRHRDVATQCAILGVLGAKYHHHGDYGSSILYHGRQLEMLKTLETPEKLTEMAKVYSMLGNAHWAMNNWEKAISLHERRLEIAEQQHDKRGMGAAYGNLGNVYHAMGDHKAAVKYHKKHQKYIETGDMETMAAVYHNLGLAHYGARETDEALDCFRHSMEIALSLGNQPQVAKIHGNLAMAYKAKGKLQEAVNELHLQLKTEIKCNDLSNAGSTTFNLGNIYVSQGDYTNALHYYERGIDLCNWHAHGTGTSNRKLGVKLLIASGSCKFHLSRHEEALSDLEKALHLSEQLRDNELLAATTSNMGLCYGALRDYDKALKNHMAHLELARMLNDKTAEGAAHGNIGNTFKAIGQHNKAIDHYEKDLSIAMETGDLLAQGQAFDNLGLSCQAVGEYTLSMEYHRKALTVMKELGYKAGEGEAHSHLGNAHGRLGNTKKSIEHHHNHLDICKVTKDIEGQCRAYGALGKACYDIGFHDKAVEYQASKLKLARQLKDYIGEARASGHLFLAYTALGDPRKAEDANRHHRSLCAKHNLHTIEESEDGVSHIRMEIAEALQDPDTQRHTTQRLAHIASRLG
eukprot:TRINITY_DN37116_c0_g1_i1.p1 TRINITY_DN37116_c0_g1~~TRINITY_DN37116_c0_g1_i1.p1  ORF type:complete len:1106 (+),score=237.36 TRINITY_DN37116_c0_g1_i1:61-3378(+)